MRHRQIRRELEKSVRSVLRRRTLPIVLRDYQRETLVNAANWLRKTKGSKAAYVEHATGLGKTVEFAAIVSEAKKLRCLIVVPSKLLVAQTVQEIVKFTKHSVGHVSSLGKIHDDKNGELIAMKGTSGQRIVVTTDMSFKIHAKKLAREFKPQVVIRDECHWSYTELSQQATKLFPEAVIIGYSATPDYLTTIAKPAYIPVTLDNGQVLYVPPNRMAQTYYPTMLDRRTLRWGIEHEYLAPLAWGFLELNASLDGVSVVAGLNGPDYDPEELAEMMKKHWPLLEEVICRLYQDNAYNIRQRKVCAICTSVAQAESLAKKISKYVPSACVVGTTLDDERDEVLDSFDADQSTKKDVRFISSVSVLREGWNTRNAEVALMLRPTKSRTLYAQFMGRIMRLRRDGKKKIALVLDLLFTGTKLAPLNAPALYGVPGEKIREGDILIAPKRKGKTLRLTSPYLPKNVRPRIRVVHALDIDQWANTDGFINIDGKIFGGLQAVSVMLGISKCSITARTQLCKTVQGRGRNGILTTFYSLSEVKKVCADLLKPAKIRLNGFLELKGEFWGSRSALALKFKTAKTTIDRKGRFCRSIQGKSRSGTPITLYSLTDMEKACASLTKAAQVGSSGFLRSKGEFWGSINALVKKLRTNKEAIHRGIKFCRSLLGKNLSGMPTTLYALKDMEKFLRKEKSKKKK